MIVFDAEGGDNDIDRFANCDALLSEGAKVVSTFDGDVGCEEIEDGEIGEEMFGPVVVRVLAKPLEDFGEDKVADRDRLGGEELVKEIGLWGRFSVKVVNPNAGINNNHGLTIIPYPFSCDRGRRPTRVYPVAPGGSVGFSFGSAGSGPVRQLLVVL